MIQQGIKGIYKITLDPKLNDTADYLHAMRLAGLRLGQPHRTHRRMREHHRRDIAVVEPGILLTAEQAVHQPARSGDRHRREHDAVDDVAQRVHAVGVTDTMGAGLVLLGCGLHSGFTLVTVKLFTVWLFIYITGPAATHALAKAAYAHGIKVDVEREDRTNGAA